MAVKPQSGRKGRREQAIRTRDRILDAALALFMEQGYDDTTIQEVAAAAGVAVQTVYFTFGNKARLLSQVQDRVVLGNAPAEHWAEQPWAAELRSETDPRKLLELFVEVDSQIKRRVSPFISRLGAALPNDTSQAAGRDARRDAFFGTVIDRLHQLGALRPGLSRDRALDILRVVDSLEAYVELTERRGWSGEEWREWLGRVLQAELLGATPS
ncbi:MAG TPA: TetR/AcrR family transcriptional regulator [Isosphaeraceae bacterium]|nr:TetR/AcrR family transcriptional regulator [Isosphaeraceae bacterium]